MLVIVPLASGGSTSSVSVPVAPEAMPLMAQVSVVVPVQTSGGVEDTNVVPGGRMSGTVTPVAGLGPALATVIVYSRSPPTGTGSGRSALVSDRSAVGGITVVSTEAELFPPFGSGVSEDTEAVLVVGPGVVGVTVMVTDGVAPKATVPRLQVTMPDASPQLPCEALAAL